MSERPRVLITHTTEACSYCGEDYGRTTEMYIMVDEGLRLACHFCKGKTEEIRFRILQDRMRKGFNPLSCLKQLVQWVVDLPKMLK